MTFISELFSGGASELVNSVGSVLDKVVTTKEEKLQLELELKKADQQYTTDMRKLDIVEEELTLNDVKSARIMNTDVQNSQNATKLSKNVSAYLAIGTVILTFVLFYTVLFIPNKIASDRKDVVIYILGVLSAVTSQIFSFYFGSSQGSADKSKHIEQLGNKIIDQQRA